jgi:serine/threonine protein kinase
MRQAADALAAAHAAGIIHRDVKPSNMLVASDGEVKLTDFGIARAEADASLTQTGLVTGSPAYLAPEVASGRTATEASDVWSLGATLFHLLSGSPPYDVSDNLMGALYKIVHEDPPRLPNAGWLAPVLEHTMTRSPENRWSMEQVREFVAGGPAVAITPAPPLETDPEGTRVLQATPAEPVAVPPVVAASETTGRLVPPSDDRPRSPWPWVVAAVVLLVAVISGAALLGGTRGGSPSAGGPSSHDTRASSPSSSGTDADAAAMRTFITHYLSTVTSDQHASWAMLTTGFQKESGGFGHYQQFWRGYTSATPHDIQADPTDLSVSYGVDYVLADGGTKSDEVTLQLVRNGSSYLINGES